VFFQQFLNDLPLGNINALTVLGVMMVCGVPEPITIRGKVYIPGAGLSNLAPPTLIPGKANPLTIALRTTTAFAMACGPAKQESRKNIQKHPQTTIFGRRPGGLPFVFDFMRKPPCLWT